MSSGSRVLWNRSELDLRSDEMLAQIVERGDIADWRTLYALLRQHPDLRSRLQTIVRTVPLPLPRFWLAALASLGESVDFEMNVPDYFGRTTI